MTDAWETTGGRGRERGKGEEAPAEPHPGSTGNAGAQLEERARRVISELFPLLEELADDPAS